MMWSILRNLAVLRSANHTDHRCYHWVLSVVFFLSCVPSWGQGNIIRIMPVGDSITEGGSSFSNWRYPLWEKLYTAGYLVKYVGSRKSPSRNGNLLHEGYGGKNSGFLASTVPANFKKFPADVVLLHAGHNQFADQKPVPQIILDTQSLIQSFRDVNPKVTVLLAQPIPSAKLPKYSYMPELHLKLAALAKFLDTPDSRIMIVPMADGFDPVKDTVADQVHPNASGAAKMTNHWFAGLVKVLEKPALSYAPALIPYKKTTKGDLTLHVFSPQDPAGSKPRPAIVFFFGGGWTRGTPLQFYPECQWFAQRGWIAVSADYRIATTHATTAFDAVEDGKSAIRYLRGHAKELGIDPHHIVAAGASAGGQVAAATGTLCTLDLATENLAVSSKPDAMLLWYPVIDNGPGGYGDAAIMGRFQEISPIHHITKSMPPSLILLGDRDPLIPVATAEKFRDLAQQAGAHCELILLPGAGHPAFRYLDGPSALRDSMLADCWKFLTSQGFNAHP